jgi:hypothetical protein
MAKYKYDETKPATAPAPATKQVEIEEVRVERLGNEKWRVTSARYVQVPGSETVLEEKVSLPVARATAILWRAKRGGVAWELP